MLHCIHEEQTSVCQVPVADCLCVARNHLLLISLAVNEGLSVNYDEYADDP